MRELDPEFKKHLEEALEEVATGDVGPITAERELGELGLDSISIAEMILILEDKVDVDIEQEELEQLRTFADLEDLVGRLLKT